MGTQPQRYCGIKGSGGNSLTVVSFFTNLRSGCISACLVLWYVVRRVIGFQLLLDALWWNWGLDNL